MPSNDVHSEELRQKLLNMPIKIDYQEVYDTTLAKMGVEWIVDAIMPVISTHTANAVREARIESSKKLQTKLTKYADGEVSYHNGEATVPISEVLAELAGADRIQSLNERKA